MIPITINLAEVPDEERRALSSEAIRRGVPFEVVVREAMIAAAKKLAGKQEEEAQPA